MSIQSPHFYKWLKILNEFVNLKSVTYIHFSTLNPTFHNVSQLAKMKMHILYMSLL